MRRTGLVVTLHRTPLLQILRSVFGGSRASRVRPPGRESTVRLHTRERSWSWNRIVFFLALFCAGVGAALPTHDALDHHGRDTREHGLAIGDDRMSVIGLDADACC